MSSTILFECQSILANRDKEGRINNYLFIWLKIKTNLFFFINNTIKKSQINLITNP